MLPSNLMNGLVLSLNGVNNGTTWYDQSGKGNNGTQTGSITTQRIGANQSVIVHPNSDNRITVTRTADLEPTTGTVLTWAKVNSSARAKVLIGVNDTINTDRYGYLIWMSSTSNDLNYEIANASASQVLTVSTSYVGARHLFGMTWDGTTLKGYLDGKLLTSAAQTLTIAYNAKNIVIGGDATNATRYMDGYSGLQKVYNRALTGTEMQQLAYYKPLNTF